MVRAKTVALSDAPTDQPLAIHHLSDTDTSLLGLLEDIGLMPGCEVRIVRRRRNGMIVRVENRGEVSITEKISGSVYVMA